MYLRHSPERENKVYVSSESSYMDAHEFYTPLWRIYGKLYYAVKLERSRPESDLSHLSGIRREAAYNGRKDLVNCKIVPRSLVELR